MDIITVLIIFSIFFLGIQRGALVLRTRKPVSVELGSGIMHYIFDGFCDLRCGVVEGELWLALVSLEISFRSVSIHLLIAQRSYEKPLIWCYLSLPHRGYV